MRKVEKGSLLLLAAAAVLLGSGCSRRVLNYQVAECIGTLDKYENNEPVETPKMKAERERRESEEALEAEKQKVLDSAAVLAAGYQYQEAIDLLENAELLQGDEKGSEAVAEYQKLLDSQYEYTGDIPHFSFTNLVIDPERAFDGDEYASAYRQNMITLTEFRNILQTLHENGYVLVDLHDLTEETPEQNGSVRMAEKALMLPQGKKPMVLSVDNVSYSSVRNGDGVATRMTVGKDGKPAAVYTDEGGHDLTGAYDVIPALEEFIEEHPDFSYRGARGIVSVAGERGIFGYPVEHAEGTDNTENENAIREVASALRESGWTIASAGYSYQYMSNMSYEQLSADMTKWLDQVAPLVGQCDTILYPYGAEVDYTSEKGAFLLNRGFCYHIGMWAEGDHREVNEHYFRQTRRMVTGLVFQEAPGSFTPYFETAGVIDPVRK